MIAPAREIDAMHPPVARRTIDFHASVDPAHAWILGLVPGTGSRLEVVTTDRSEATTRRPAEPRDAAPGAAACTCPDWWCPVDHSAD